MTCVHKAFRTWHVIVLLLGLVATPKSLCAQEEKPIIGNRDTLIEAAREIMDTARLCTLITMDSAGQPHVRTMDPFAPGPDMVVWLATNPKSRKVSEIRNNPHVTLYYADPAQEGYVTISGAAQLVDDPAEKAKRWKDEWQAFYPNREDAYLLIKVIPEKLEVFNSRHGVTGNPETWRVPTVTFESKE